MEWYYAVGVQQNGPVGPEELDRLVRTGAVTSETMVWREGMSGWRPYGQVAQEPPVSRPPPAAGSVAPQAAGVVCTECGRAFPLDEVVRLGKGYVCASCKPQALQKLREGVVDSASEEIRKAHIKHEASIKSIGILYYLGGIFVGIMGIMVFLVGGGASALPQNRFIGLFLLALAAAQLFTGTGLRRLKSWARAPTGILSGIGLFGFPMGTLINGWILYLVFSKKGSTVFSEEYRRVIAETPHIKYRTSVVVWILLGLLLLLIAIAVLAALIRPIR